MNNTTEYMIDRMYSLLHMLFYAVFPQWEELLIDGLEELGIGKLRNLGVFGCINEWAFNEA